MTTPTPIEVIRALHAPFESGGPGPGDLTHADQLMAVDFINHAAGPQGRSGWKAIVMAIETDLGPVTIENHHLLADGEFVTHHMTLHGTHRSSQTPFFAGREPTGQAVAWRYIHIWRVVDVLAVEHWACRDDLALLAQLEPAQGPNLSS